MITLKNKKLLFLAVVILFNFALTETSSAMITRDEIINIAESYKNHLWTASRGNVCSNKIVWRGDKQVRIDTPDEKCKKACFNRGWWSPKKVNQGVPYKWGGFNTLSRFDEGIRSGSCGGDVCNKSIELSSYGSYDYDAVGIDCSGFVSRCWNQGTKYSTRSIPKTFRELENYDDLKKGDALDRAGSHVMLFKEFMGSEFPYYTLKVYEASAKDWRVWDREYSITYLRDVEKYKPYSPFKPIDIELLVDRSMSMGNGKLVEAKKAAKQFVGLMKGDDKVGVASFSGEAEANYQLTKISKDDPSIVKTAAQNAIDLIFIDEWISPSPPLPPNHSLYSLASLASYVVDPPLLDMTSIGAGLQVAQKQLNLYGKTEGKKDDLKTIILLTDGNENSPPYVRDVLNGITKDKIRICPIGFGDDVNHKLLNKIARQADCVYKSAVTLPELYLAYQSLRAEISGEEMIKMEKFIVGLKKIFKFVFVDASVSSVTFSASWKGSDVDLVLVDPNGNIIDHETDNPDIEFVEGDTYEFYRIEEPQQGKWQMEIKGVDIPNNGEECVLSVSGENAIVFETETDKEVYSPGEEIKITASLDDSITETPFPQYISGAKIKAEAKIKVTDSGQNDQNSYFFELNDNGRNGDEEAGDGIYTAVFSNTSAPGDYSFTLNASGKTNRADDSFTRVKTISALVTDSVPENIPPVAEANGPYDGYVGIPIIFDSSGSSDLENRPLKYRWDFNDDGVFDTDWLNEPMNNPPTSCKV